MEFLMSAWCGCLPKWKRAGKGDEGCEGEDEEDYSSNFFFLLQTLQLATNYFSDENQLGHGGFGPVFKGLVPNGPEVAVKKLSLDSRQGIREFTNEVKVLLRTQHKNLVTLLGCCAEGPEKMLVYEYLPNKSLDSFLFDETKSSSLDWTKRYQIISGVARGLLYLHEEAPERIIHRDIKASNILLDGQLNPKISDFGLARLFPGEDTHLNTFRISGTHGYMAPEYAMCGYLSVKADVFSYGILVLEIVSGRKNHDSSLSEEEADLLNHAWNLYQEGNASDLADPVLAEFNHDETAMCIQMALLCCQASVAERPDMSSVNLILSSDSFTLPKPGKPGIQGRVGHWTTTSSAKTGSNATGTTGTCTDATKASTDCSLDENNSRNSVSISFVDKGH